MLNESLIICMIVLCIWYTMQEGEIFFWVAKILDRYLPDKSHPAVFSCNVCMTPWYGSALYWFFPWGEVALPSASLVAWPLVIFTAMGFQIVINKFQDQRDQNVEITNIEELKEVIDEPPKKTKKKKYS